MDRKRRSLVKSITWRIAGIVILGGITYLVTSDWQQMTLITVLFHSIRMVLYYYHERAWEHVRWGKLSHPLADIALARALTPEHHQEIEQRLRALGY